MKCQSLFSGITLGDSLHEISKPIFRKNRKTIISLSSAESAQRVVKGKVEFFAALGTIFALCGWTL